MSLKIDDKTVIAADLDGTLAESKAPMSQGMINTVANWLNYHRFVVISGGNYGQFAKQITTKLPEGTVLENLFLFPTNGAACYAFQGGGWRKVYEDALTEDEKTIITAAFEKAKTIEALTPLMVPERVYGDQIEYRGGQITFSGLGQETPLEIKSAWDPDQAKRKAIVAEIAPLLPDFTISIGGTSSIDITRKGIDKAYALEKMKKLLNVDNDHVIFLGDAIFEGGNDWAATRTGVTCIKVENPNDTMSKIVELLEKTS